MSKKFVWTDAGIAMVRKGYADGTPTKQLGDMIGCSAKSVQDKAKKLGLWHRNFNRPPPENRKIAPERLVSITLPYIPPPRFSA